ncbi:MAG: glycosyltransferase [Cyclobacteriaceae bacterium]
MPKYSIIIPVYNRPDELNELLISLTQQEFNDFEVIVVEDGSLECSDEICERYKKQLNLAYFYKENSGPGLSRNFGAEKSSSDVLIFLDSDCMIPNGYFEAIESGFKNADAFGGPDAAHDSFSVIQKAINYSMTSFFSTGGIRGSKKSIENFKPRSFNMGIKKGVFEKLAGFGKMRFGEDIDLSIRLEKMGFDAILIPGAFVYHKRRTSLRQFYKQVFNSGIARVNLGVLHPGSDGIVHALPALFVFGSIVSIIALLNGFYIPFMALIGYLALILVHATYKSGSPIVGLISCITTLIQISGYGLGFVKAFVRVRILKKPLKFGFERSFYQ